MNYPFSGIIVRYLGKASSHIAAPDPAPPPRDQLHVNLWDVAGRHYIDIGLMVTSPTSVDQIWIDIPWRATEDNVLDLGAKLDGEKIITAIFNELVLYRGESEKEYANVKLEYNNGDEFEFSSIRLGRQCFKFENQPAPIESTRIKITWPSLDDLKGNGKENHPRYVRIRIGDVPFDAFFSNFRPKDRNLLSSSVTTALFDFRINVRRGIPDQVLLGEPKLGFPKFAKIHLFVIVDRETELAFHSGSFKGCRSLEDESIWNEYLDLSRNVKRRRSPETVRDYLGYQWSVSEKKSADGSDTIDPAKDLVALGRFTHAKSSFWNNGRFVVIVVLLGCSGSALWDILKARWLLKGDTPTAITPGHMEWRLMLLLMAVGLLLLSDRETAIAILRAAKHGVLHAIQWIKDRWHSLR